MRNNGFTLIETLIAVAIIISAFSVLLSIEPNTITHLKWLEIKTNAAQLASITTIDNFTQSTQVKYANNILSTQYGVSNFDIDLLGFDSSPYQVSCAQTMQSDGNFSIFIQTINTKDGAINIIRLAK